VEYNGGKCCIRGKVEYIWERIVECIWRKEWSVLEKLSVFWVRVECIKICGVDLEIWSVFRGKSGVDLEMWSGFRNMECILRKSGVHLEMWSGFRNVECIKGKSGVNLEMWSVYGERVECI